MLVARLGMPRLKLRKALLVASLLLPLLGAGLAVTRAQQPLIADLSNHLVAITTGFVGTEVLLFGATEEAGDVVVVVRGPVAPVTVHRKTRVLGIWVNTAAMAFAQAPSFYSVAASRPLDQVAAPTVLSRHEMGVKHLRLPLPRARASENVAQEWREALVRNKQRQGLYSVETGNVSFVGERLFRANLYLPANVPTGAYHVQVYYLKEGQVVGAQTTPLIVSKIGLEAEIFDFAHNHGAYYGLIAILVALVAGWLGNVMFRKA